MASTAERVVAPSAERRGGPTAARAVAWAAALGALGAAAAALATADDVGTDVGVGAALAVLWAMTAVLLGRRRPSEPMAALAAIGAFATAVAVLGGVFVTEGTVALGTLLRWLGLGLLPATGLAISIGLPDGRINRRHRVAVGIFAVAGLGLAVALAVARPSPLWPMVILAIVAAVFAAGWSAGRYRRAHGIARQRMQWFGLATTLGMTIAAVGGALYLLVSWPDDRAVVAAVALAWMPLSLLAGTSERLVAHVDRLLGHMVSLAGLVGLIAAVYIVVVLGLGEIPDEEGKRLLALSMAAAAVAALLFPATRARLQDVATRIVYGEQHAPDEVLRTFGSRLTRDVPMDELLLQASESLRKTFGLDVVEIWTGQAGQLDRTVSLPERGKARMTIGAKELPVMARAGVTGPAWLKVWLPAVLEKRAGSMVRLAPIAHQGEVLGAIIVERRDSADVFSEEEERVLTDLARTVGVALHNVQLDSALQETLDEVRRQAEDLRRSRQRIVKAADEARRKLQGDLHDGAQQHVVALAVKTKLIKTILDSDVDTAKQMLDELGTDITEAVQQLRDFAHGIYPPILANMGLEAALGNVASKAVLPTAVDAEGLRRYPEDVEAAVYFCCLEALTNAGKHAGEGASATIRLREEEGVLLFEVGDDGAGFDAASKGLGAGFVNMKDRVGAAGGTLKVDSAPGEGTWIAGRIPVAAS